MSTTSCSMVEPTLSPPIAPQPPVAPNDKTLGQAFSSLTDDVQTVYLQVRQGVIDHVDQAPWKPTAVRIYAFVVEHGDVLFWGIAAVHALSGSLSFTLGLIGGMAYQIGYRAGWVNRKMITIESNQAKVEYATVAVISRLFFSSLVRSFAASFVVGTYVFGYFCHHGVPPEFVRVWRKIKYLIIELL